MIAQQYKGLGGNTYTIGKEIGLGGEGAVLEVVEDKSIVIKVYSEPLLRDKMNKLLYMATLKDAELLKFAAWPLDVVRDNNSVICGFTMNKLEGFVPLHMLFSPMNRKRIFPDKGYDFLIHVARNLASAFHKIHHVGIVIGDVNEANILVNQNGLISLIDCDSFQIENRGIYHLCEVGVPRYTSPELLHIGSFANQVRTIKMDSFSLATLIFQLLFFGRPPFTGIPLTNAELTEEDAIKLHQFAYSLRNTQKKIGPAKNTFELKSLTNDIIELFHLAFETIEQRPLPSKWVVALDAISKELIICEESRLHLYPKKLGECPWCKFKKNSGVIFFLDDEYLTSVPELGNIEQFVNGFRLERIQLNKLSDVYLVNSSKPIVIDQKFKLLKVMNWSVIGVAILTTIGLCFISLAFLFAGFVFIAIFNAFSPTERKLKDELTRRKTSYEQAKSNFESLVKQHNNPPELSRYNVGANKLASLINEFKALPKEFEKQKRKIEETDYNLQYDTYLKGFDIRDFAIPSFGAAKKRLIYSNGIRNAADITKLSIIRINGIGPANIHILQTWQRQMGTGFSYVPNYAQLNHQISSIARTIALRKQKLETEIKEEYRALHYLEVNILSLASTLSAQYEVLGSKLNQEELEYNGFKAFAMVS
jgi:DNA-binding helix-hairpin-helix protein with protein kinase domain